MPVLVVVVMMMMILVVIVVVGVGAVERTVPVCQTVLADSKPVRML